MKRFAPLFLLLVTALLTNAQGYTLDGTILGATDHTLLEEATLKLTPLADSTNWRGNETDSAGYFRFNNLPNGDYRLLITFLGYTNRVIPVKITGADKHLGQLTISPNATMLQTVQIVEKQTRVEQKADTSEYNAGAYKTNPDANAEDLVTKMPGITSDNGTVKAHGETVQKVYVDGKEFFGDDATLALKNLPAEVIDKVQVFDRMSDQAQFTGFDDGNSQKALNIITKRGKNNGIFGKFYAGYGYITDSRYAAGANLNWFSGDRRLSLIGMSNNVNQQNFATQDLLGVVGTTSQRGGAGGGGRGGRGGGGGGGNSPVNNFLVNNQGGITTTHSVGLNYTDVWGKNRRVKVTGSYFFNYSGNKSSSTLNRQYFNTGDSSTYYNESNNNQSTNMNHRINLRLEYAIDTLNKLIFTPKISFQQNNQTNSLNGQTTLAEGALLGQTQSLSIANNFGYTASGDILYQHRFKKPRRTFSIDIAGSVNNKTGSSSLNSSSKYSQPADTVDLDQQANILGRSYTLSGSISYTEPIAKTGMLQFNYTPANTWNKSDKETNNFDSVSHTYTLLDTSLSNKYDNYYMTHKAGVTYRFLKSKLSFNVGVYGQYALLSGMEVFPVSGTITKSFINVLPNAVFTYKFTDKNMLRIFYRTSTNPPSIAQLQSVIDNSNPLLLSTGNPDLKQAYSHNFVVRYSLSNSKTAQSFFAFLSGGFTQQSVANSTIIASHDTVLSNEITLHAGSQLSKPVNLNGNMNLSAFLTYGIPLDKIKCNLNLNAGTTYGRTPSLINGSENFSNNYNVNAGFVLSSNISEKIDFTISYSGSYNIVKNTLQTTSDNHYYNHTASAKFNWMFYKGFVFNTNLQNTLYAGVTPGYNQDIFLWNAALGYKFLKDQSLEVKASVNDILNQNSGIARTVTETYIEDSKTQVLKRYFLLTITYTLRQFKKS